MVINKKRAFSLAEMIMAMLIIMIAAVAALPSITLKAPQIPVTTIRGQYACWRGNDGSLYQWKMDERTPDPSYSAPEPDSNGRLQPQVNPSECKLTFDSRPAHFYVVAAGKDSRPNLPAAIQKYNDNGEVVTKYTPTLANTLNITIPGEGVSSPVVVTGGTGSDFAEISAAPASEFLPNGLKHSNIDKDSCMIKSVSTQCSNYPDDNSRKHSSCEIVSVDGGPEKYVKVLGCNKTDDYGNPSDENLIPLHCFQPVSSSTCNNIDFTKLPEDFGFLANGSRHKVDATSYKFEYTDENSLPDDCKGKINNVLVSFRQKGSTHTKNTHIMGCSNTTVSKHKFIQILDNLPNYRHSELIDKLRAQYDDNGDGQGAVLILW